MRPVVLTLTARQWATIDATMDNAVHAAIDDFADHSQAMAIREAGWEQVPWVGEAKQWPPDEQMIGIALRREQWDLVLAELDGDAASYARLGDATGLALGQDAGTAVRQQLG
jgi:hypothetical protein